MKQHLLQFVSGEGYHLGIWHQNNLAGILDYRLCWRNRKAERGYWIDTLMQGKGGVIRVCRAMIRHAFEEHQVEEVKIPCATENTRSRAIPERLGFVQDGILRRAGWIHDRYVDGVFYGLLRQEWLASLPSTSSRESEEPG